ncbi:hypothetical protein [Curtobacterium sp. MCPF17_031]|uniref:hypothetical protein n=1 Tax=Curtobacterium sp. MCPF17_031 TaxID=2175653 RepID=UPI000DA82959|nr:hypothetical protein [Curtobacterium sp. MCPF17_031]PZE36955.1 hypothetical protein DEJ31_07355 [Curtobacterium sp. MCPF17_031]
MKYLIYGVASVMTSDEAAYAVLDYATALAQSGLADRVDVPSVDDYGMAATSSFILAPAIGVLVQSVPDDELGPETTQFAADPRTRTHAVQVGRVH